ncbi:hypothetical protein NE237_028513 [Protea cynaroides]|uniref:Uncharacterized protein n=1 Tax=Protea cynaroides TaxID=273540 RepID=A0A9Q0GPI2_9MAGN|nr:hypothetical protein NE237_028513 [Protea cynaroides]
MFKSCYWLPPGCFSFRSERPHFVGLLSLGTPHSLMLPVLTSTKRSYAFLQHPEKYVPWATQKKTLSISSEMGNGDKTLLNFHLPLPYHHHGKKDQRAIPKGCFAIMVGQGEEQQRFVIPVMYINHPLFMQLLKEAEDEYGFDQKGTITIPCHVEEFRNVQRIIDKENSIHHHHHHHHHHNHHHNHHPIHLHLAGCFRVIHS